MSWGILLGLAGGDTKVHGSGPRRRAVYYHDRRSRRKDQPIEFAAPMCAPVTAPENDDTFVGTPAFVLAMSRPHRWSALGVTSSRRPYRGTGEWNVVRGRWLARRGHLVQTLRHRVVPCHRSGRPACVSWEMRGIRQRQGSSTRTGRFAGFRACRSRDMTTRGWRARPAATSPRCSPQLHRPPDLLSRPRRSTVRSHPTPVILIQVSFSAARTTTCRCAIFRPASVWDICSFCTFPASTCAGRAPAGATIEAISGHPGAHWTHRAQSGRSRRPPPDGAARRSSHSSPGHAWRAVLRNRLPRRSSRSSAPRCAHPPTACRRTTRRPVVPGSSPTAGIWVCSTITTCSVRWLAIWRGRQGPPPHAGTGPLHLDVDQNTITSPRRSVSQAAEQLDVARRDAATSAWTSSRSKSTSSRSPKCSMLELLDHSAVAPPFPAGTPW